MLTHTNMLSAIKSLIERRLRADLPTFPDDRHCSFLPLAHLYERLFLHGSQVVYCPTPEKVFEYYPIVQPTTVAMVPRILNKVYDTVMTEVNKSKIKRFLISQALHNEKPSLFSRFIFRKVKNLFGGKLKIMLTGSAPITHEVLHFFRIALDIPIAEAYGQTESSGAAISTHVADLSCGMVGTPVSVVEVKLIDVPGTTYRSDNNQGEVCLRGPPIFKG
jgi:long-chain acyl-CoA synthetase